MIEPHADPPSSRCAFGDCESATEGDGEPLCAFHAQMAEWDDRCGSGRVNMLVGGGYHVAETISAPRSFSARGRAQDRAGRNEVLRALYLRGDKLKDIARAVGLSEDGVKSTIKVLRLKRPRLNPHRNRKTAWKKPRHFPPKGRKNEIHIRGRAKEWHGMGGA
jgi:hypothetical protein